MKIKTKKDRRRRIQLRARKRVRGTGARPRLTVFRSAAHIYVQAVDDAAGRTIAAASSAEPATRATFADGARGGNVKGAARVGTVIAERLAAKGVRQVVFDRGGFLYHGRVRAVAEAARAAGLEF
ncbi:MAG TPA: 50S ribosomal protein L18 [Vicinamibacterales bacterium]|nr:50S ribosomal protein L18 [Vicinamibacterales bacterium]HOQ61797.1 50S ribosomal protein L18 [Vicinamibacterales bacterium]HPK72375.1 50S ribosomal protein L18 [Vicinamibacterales bacterium]HPW22056.1 50S ribosomal protein L18 [Vicinamibacterales bacterium]